MRKLHFLSVGVAVIGSLAIAACVGDAPVAAPQGALDQPCFPDGKCNPGLSCDATQLPSTCVPADDASPDDASGVDGGTDDSGQPICQFAQTKFPCTGGLSTAACYGATQTCATTGCSDVTDQVWSCFSPNQCSTLACCLSATSATLSPKKNCSQGALAMLEGATGTSCASKDTCGAGDTQLCQFNDQCPAGQICSPVKVVSLVDGGAAALNGVILGACSPL